MIELLAYLAAAAATPASPAASVPAPDPQRLATARQMLDILVPVEHRSAFLDQTVSSTLRTFIVSLDNNRSLQEAVKAKPEVRIVVGNFLQRQRDLINQDLDQTRSAFNEALARGYARKFTVEELNKLRDFFAQPVGRKYLDEAPKVLADPDMQAWLADMAKRTQQRMPAEIETLRQQVMNAGKLGK